MKMKWKIIFFVVGFSLFYLFLIWLCIANLGCAGPGGPSTIINQYEYALPAPTPSVMSLNPNFDPNAPLSPVDYQTIYASSFDDPTLVVFNNKSYRKVKIIIDSQKPIELTAYQTTADLHLGVGEHRAKIVLEKPTQAHGTLEVIREFRVEIRPEGRSQIFYIYD